MNDATAHALNSINRAFYRDHAVSFHLTRRDPWPGWTRLVPYLERAGVPGTPLSVLEIGCGNARFARFLYETLERPVVYRGIDASASLLEEARIATRGMDATLEQRDLVEDPLKPPRDAASRACVAAFGVFHHIPGASRRRQLLLSMIERLEPGGLLALAFWDFGADPRFAKRELSVSEYNRRAPQPVDPQQLERGDVLLRWGPPEVDALRYCHWLDPDEEQELLEGLGLVTVAAFASDGRSHTLNRYRVLSRPD